MNALQKSNQPPVIQQMADRFQIDPESFKQTLLKTAFSGTKQQVTEEQFVMLMTVANKYNLDPFTREIYAFEQNGGIVPIVSIDGWTKMTNNHPQFDGMKLTETLENGLVIAVTCVMWRKDRNHPIEITEYLRECKRNTGPWNQWPARMLRHKAIIQCARLAFGFSGIQEQDEAERQVEGERVDVKRKAQSLNERVNLASVHVEQVDTDTGEVIEVETDITPIDEQPTEKPMPGKSPSASQLFKKLNECTDPAELEAMKRSPLLRKCSADERKTFFDALEIKLEILGGKQ